VYVQK